MSKLEKLRKKAENAWTDCDSCNSNDKSMWINGYIVGALANQIELPTDEVEEKSEKPIILEISNLDIQRKRWEDWEDFNKMAQYSPDSASPYADGFTRGAKWMRDKIKGGQDEN